MSIQKPKQVMITRATRQLELLEPPTVSQPGRNAGEMFARAFRKSPALGSVIRQGETFEAVGMGWAGSTKVYNRSMEASSCHDVWRISSQNLHQMGAWVVNPGQVPTQNLPVDRNAVLQPCTRRHKPCSKCPDPQSRWVEQPFQMCHRLWFF